MKETIVEKQISTCFRSIRNLLYFVGVMGTGVASTIGFADAVVKHLGSTAFNAILVIEFIAIALSILHIFLKFVRIEKLNLKERGNGNG